MAYIGLRRCLYKWRIQKCPWGNVPLNRRHDSNIDFFVNKSETRGKRNHVSGSTTQKSQFLAVKNLPKNSLSYGFLTLISLIVARFRIRTSGKVQHWFNESRECFLFKKTASLSQICSQNFLHLYHSVINFHMKRIKATRNTKRAMDFRCVRCVFL